MMNLEVIGKNRKEVLESINQRIEKCHKILFKLETPEHYKDMSIFEREVYRAMYIDEISELTHFLELFGDKENKK